MFGGSAVSFRDCIVVHGEIRSNSIRSATPTLHQVMLVNLVRSVEATE